MSRRAVLLAFSLTVAAGFGLAAPLGAQEREQGRDQGQDIPPAYRPPPGMCRIWLDSVPPEHQPAPTDCPSAIRRRPANARVIFGGDAPAKVTVPCLTAGCEGGKRDKKKNPFDPVVRPSSGGRGRT